MLVNLTPHPVVIIANDGTVIADIPPSGNVARLAETAVPDGTRGGIPMTRVSLGTIEGLSPAWRDTLHIVSMPLLMGARAAGVTRTDLVYPFGQVRDETGRIIGCRSLAAL